MIYFVNEKKDKILVYTDGEIEVFTMLDFNAEANKKEIPVRTGKPQRGDKGIEIAELLKNGIDVKGIINRLRQRFPKISPQDVYVVKNKLKKSEPKLTERDSPTGKGDMITMYGKTAVDKVIDMHLNEKSVEDISEHKDVRLKPEQVEEIISNCV